MKPGIRKAPAKFGALLGVAPGGVPIYSSDYDSADEREYPTRQSYQSHVHGVFMGYKWQCVEFARRWLYLNKGYIFEDIPMAYDIFNLRFVRRISDNAALPLHAFGNGSRRLPEPGCLLIWNEGGEFARTGHVAIVTDPADYPLLAAEMQANGGALTDATRFALAKKAFSHTAEYDGAISNYLTALNASNEREAFGEKLNLQFTRAQTCRYGENPHQAGAFYVEAKAPAGTISTARQIQGKELSYNNIADTDAALECVKQFDAAPACVIVKHANPCGVAYGATLLEAYDRAYQTDPESAFGGIIAFNGRLDGATAAAIVERQFVEVIIAPEVSPEASAAVAAKKNVRLLECGKWTGPIAQLDMKRVAGGLLVQDADALLHGELKTVTDRAPTPQEMDDLLFAWRVAKFVKSNAIVYAKGRMTVGVGAGQMSRINSARIAAIKAEHAGLPVPGSVMASDAFFPFRDGIDQAAAAGIQAVIQPGGSMRDDEVIAAANEHGIAMVFTGTRHFRH